MAFNDEIDPAMEQLAKLKDEFRNCHACENSAIPGTFPPACRKHGGMGIIAKATAAIRFEETRQRMQDALIPAISEAIETYLKVMRTDDGFMPGTAKQVVMYDKKGNELIATDGVRVTARDMITAADRILALAGFTPEMAAVNGGISEAKNGPVEQLKKLLEAAPDDRLERLVKRLSPGIIEVEETVERDGGD